MSGDDVRNRLADAIAAEHEEARRYFERAEMISELANAWDEGWSAGVGEARGEEPERNPHQPERQPLGPINEPTVEWGIRWDEPVPLLNDYAGPFDTRDEAVEREASSAFSGVIVSRVVGAWQEDDRG